MNKHLPMYEPEAEGEELEKQLAWMVKQSQFIRIQEQDEIPAKYIKVRCGCNRLIALKRAYRCLYCDIYFCMECAEQHFGKRRSTRLVVLEN